MISTLLVSNEACRQASDTHEGTTAQCDEGKTSNNAQPASSHLWADAASRSASIMPLNLSPAPLHSCCSRSLAPGTEPQ